MQCWVLAVAMTGLAGAAQSQSVRPHYVFFDWGKPEISRDGAATLDEVAGKVRGSPARLRVIGHSDRSGPAGANLRSSRLRAERVAAYLAEKGVSRPAISVEAFGETRPYVPTEDGVREPQNRRVEIWIAE